MSNILEFKETDSSASSAMVLRLGGNSFLPQDIEWPVNPNGERLTLILSLPA